MDRIFRVENFLKPGEEPLNVVVFVYGRFTVYHIIKYQERSRPEAAGVWRIQYKKK